MRAAALWMTVVVCSVGAAVTEGDRPFWVFFAVLVAALVAFVGDDGPSKSDHALAARIFSGGALLALAFAFVAVATDRPWGWWLAAMLAAVLLAGAGRIVAR